MVSFGIVAMLSFIIYYGLQQDKVSEKLGYSKEQATNLTGIWEGIYNAKGVAGCIKLKIYKKIDNKTFKGLLFASQPLTIDNAEVAITAEYIDTAYARMKISNKEKGISLSGKVRNSEVATLKGILKDEAIKEITLTKNKEICLPSQKEEISRFEEKEYEVLLKDLLLPSCYVLAKDYEEAFKGKTSLEIKENPHNPCSLFVKDLKLDAITEKPKFQNRTYVEYEHMKVYLMPNNIYVVIFE